MDLAKVREIKECYSAGLSNRFLELGWALLAVAAENPEPGVAKPAKIVYSLGWIHEEPPKYPEVRGNDAVRL